MAILQSGIVAEWVCGPLFFRKFVLLKAGESIPIHTHKRDHATLCLLGSMDAILRPDTPQAQTIVLMTGDTLPVQKDDWHTLVAREDNTWGMCCFPHRDLLGRVTETYVGNNAAYASVA